jgi:hypothetical protein
MAEPKRRPPKSKSGGKKPTHRPSPRRQADLARARALLALLDDPEFQTASVQVIDAAARRWREIEAAGGTEATWQEHWPAFAEAHVAPVVARFHAAPMFVRSVAAPDPRWRAAMAMAAGWWGLPPLWPWLPQREIRRRVSAIYRNLRPLRSAIERPRRAVIGDWLDVHGIPRSVIAQVVSGRTTGLRRPPAARAIQRLTSEEEQRLITRWRERLVTGGMDPGQAYREAERRAIRAARGGEAPAAAAVRHALKRGEAATERLTDALLAPESHHPVSFLLTRIFEAHLGGDQPRVHQLIGELRHTLLDLG